MKNYLPSIVIIGLAMAILGLFIKQNQLCNQIKWQLQNTARLSYHAGFARAANTLKDQKDCALDTVPDVDSLFIIDVKID